MNREVKGGRGSLLAVAILHGISGILIGASIDDGDGPGVVEHMRTSSTITFALGGVFLGLWAWAKLKPLAASISGLILFVALQTLNGIFSPPSFLISAIPNLIVAVFLVRSVIAARAAREWDRMEGR